jgi:hypothetical protein
MYKSRQEIGLFEVSIVSVWMELSKRDNEKDSAQRGNIQCTLQETLFSISPHQSQSLKLSAPKYPNFSASTGVYMSAANNNCGVKHQHRVSQDQASPGVLFAPFRGPGATSSPSNLQSTDGAGLFLAQTFSIMPHHVASIFDISTQSLTPLFLEMNPLKELAT